MGRRNLPDMPRSSRPSKRGDGGARGVPVVRRARRGFASGFEAKVIKDLKERGIEYEYEPEFLDYEKEIKKAKCRDCLSKRVSQHRRYLPDLRIQSRFLVELKGKFTAENRSRMESVLASHPGIDLRFLFQRDNWLTKKKKHKYSDWALKNGVQFAIGDRIPDEWVNTSAGAAG